MIHPTSTHSTMTKEIDYGEAFDPLVERRLTSRKMQRTLRRIKREQRKAMEASILPVRLSKSEKLRAYHARLKASLPQPIAFNSQPDSINELDQKNV